MLFSNGIIYIYLSIDAHDVQILQCYLLDSFLILNKCLYVNFGNSPRFFLILINMKKPVSIISKYNITSHANRVLKLNCVYCVACIVLCLWTP